MDLPGILSDIMKDLVALNEDAADSNQQDIHSLYPSPQALFPVFFLLLIPLHIFVVIDPQQVLNRWPRREEDKEWCLSWFQGDTSTFSSKHTAAGSG